MRMTTEQVRAEIAMEAQTRAANAPRFLVHGSEQIDALELAGLRLDIARAHMSSFNARSTFDDDADEIRLGELEAALDTARTRYREIVAERCGQSADDVQRRLEI